jgi:hypothetical protein
MILFRAIVLGGLTITLAGCAGSATSSTVPTPPSAVDRPSTLATMAASPSADPVRIEGCPTSAQAGAVPSDRILDVTVEPGVGVDRITFSFGSPSGQSATPTGELRPARPPFSEAGSGSPVTIAGDRFVSIVFQGMTVADDAGNAIYRGSADLKPIAPAIQEVRLLDNFEGHLGWVAGIRGPGCVRVTRLTGPDRIVVEVQQP